MKTPKLYFKGIRSKWCSLNLGSMSTSYSGGTPSSSVKEYYIGNIPFIRSGEINKNKTELFLSHEGVNSSSARIIEKGTILYALYGATSGEVGISQITGAINQAILAIYPNEKIIDKIYLTQYLRANKQQIISTYLQGGQGNLSGSIVKSITIKYPESLKEQRQIGLFLSEIDQRIKFANNLKEKLQHLKSACLQSMFPQDGVTKPKIRFKGFNGEWERHIIGEIGFSYCGLSGKTKDDFNGGDSSYITFLNVLNNAIINPDILEKVNIKNGEQQNEVLKNDILFNTSSETPEEVGMCSVLKNDINNLYLNSFCFGFRLTDKSIDPLCFTYILRSQIGRKIMKYLAQGATRYNLSKSNLYKVGILLPSLEEQQKIGLFFEALDKQIELQSKRLEKLKQIKIACLDKMFV